MPAESPPQGFPTPVLATALSRGRTDTFFELAARYLEEYLAKCRVAIAGLPPERLWRRPRPEANSAANLILHLCGNLSLWLLASVGGEPFERDRAAEFAATSGPGAEELIARLETVVARCATLVRGLADADAERPLRIQAYDTDVRSAVFHAVEHMSYHTGQLMFLFKQSLAPGESVELYPQHRGE